MSKLPLDITSEASVISKIGRVNLAPTKYTKIMDRSKITIVLVSIISKDSSIIILIGVLS